MTGNGSGSYTFSSGITKQFVLENIELAAEACQEFGVDIGDYIVNFKWEALDVTIRCYLLGEVLGEVLNEMVG